MKYGKYSKKVLTNIIRYYIIKIVKREGGINNDTRIQLSRYFT